MAAGGGVGVGDGVGDGVGVGFGVAAGAGSAAEPPDAPVPFTTTLPVISGWIAHRYENEPACLNVRFHDPPSPIGPLLNAPSSAVTVCARSSSLRNVTEPPAAIVTVPGPNARPAIETEADFGVVDVEPPPDDGLARGGRRAADHDPPVIPRVVVLALVEVGVRALCRQLHRIRLARLEIVGVEFGGPGLRAHPMPLVVGVHEPDRRAGGDRQLGRRKAIGDPDRDGRRGSSDGRNETGRDKRHQRSEDQVADNVRHSGTSQGMGSTPT